MNSFNLLWWGKVNYSSQTPQEARRKAVLTMDLLTSPYLQWLGKGIGQTSPLSFQNIPHFGQLDCKWYPGGVQLLTAYFQKLTGEKEKRQSQEKKKITGHSYRKIKAGEDSWKTCSTSSGQLQQSNSCWRMKQASKHSLFRKEAKPHLNRKTHD